MRICVIGAGPCGIAAAKNLSDAGLADVTVFDRGVAIGGTWIFDPAPGHSSMYESAHAISSKAYSQYCDYPMPAAYPDYPGHAQLAAYFQGYARHFGVDRRVRLRTEVRHCERTADGRWQVTTFADGTREEHVFDQLVVANGHHSHPRWPDYHGRFSGEYLHSHTYKRAAPFAGKRVLVIGGGNSACDIAVDIARVASAVDMSWRRAYRIIPRHILGQPADFFQHGGDVLRRLVPRRWRDRVQTAILDLLSGNYAKYGLGKPDHPLQATHPTINSQILPALREARIHVRADVARFDEDVVHFVDGSSGRYDTVIASTGYEIRHPFFDATLVDYSRGPVPLYLRMIHPRHPNLHFIGLFQPLGCVWPVAELQAKIVARRLTGQWQPPADLDAAIRDELAHPDVVQIASPRHTITVDFPAFRRRLLAQLPRDYVRREPVSA